MSRSLPDAASEAENTLIHEARRLMGAYDRAELMIQSGLYTPGADPLLDKAVVAWPKLDAFVARTEVANSMESFLALAACLPKDGTRAARRQVAEAPEE